MNENQDTRRRGLLVGIIVLLLIVVGVQFYLLLRNQRQIEESTIIIEENRVAISRSTTELDSLRTELETRYRELVSLGGDTASLRQSLDSLDAQLGRARRDANYSRSQYNQLREDFRTLLTLKDEEIVGLKSQNEVLFQENVGLKQAIVQREDSINRLIRGRQELNEKVAVASVLQAVDVQIAVIDSRGKERDDDDNRFRARRVDKLKISFAIAENPVARIETKEVMLRVLDTDGQVLPDVATSSGTFTTAEGRALAYTARQSFLFDNRRPQLVFIYEKGIPFEAGTYPVELYAEGHLIGKSEFVIR